ncbi:outer membrane protein assembly factor BamC [Lacimicrobium alkaliphilum]|uniref:Outer membrane protein assembly factor BamC n=1 Tax=Lacimicrobium alkaliphilum TaxID=1526571 RepID=A0ABQ1QYT8_9ALTE|nr:outer membrane protein assembly factor BamC [Lacimicrobium alkaliphilum]GGD52160.1 outer membrane protein assembly factor BamC [Lacimicrobium alkaliphilum]
MIRHSLLLLSPLVLLAACSTPHERRIANDNFEYLKQDNRQKIKVPDGLKAPAQSREYQIPELGPNAPTDLLGEDLQVLSPALVLPMVTGSHIEEGQRNATVYFDQVDDSQPLDTSVWGSLISYFEQQGIGVDSFDKEEGTLVTDWMLMETEVDSGWFDWTTTERSVGKRFEFKLDVKPHGRTAALKVRLKDYLETVGDKTRSASELNDDAIRRNEVDILNQVIGHYQQQLQVADIRKVRKIREGMNMAMGTNAKGEPAFVVEGDYDIAWTRMQLVLRKLGFNVKDLDKTAGLLFVSYEGGESSWWDGLWGDDEGLPLDKQEYRLRMTRVDNNKVAITFMDNDSNNLSETLLSGIFQPFSDTMAANNLDI